MAALGPRISTHQTKELFPLSSFLSYSVSLPNEGKSMDGFLGIFMSCAIHQGGLMNLVENFFSIGYYWQIHYNDSIIFLRAFLAF